MIWWHRLRGHKITWRAVAGLMSATSDSYGCLVDCSCGKGWAR